MRKFSAFLAFILLLSVFSVTAYAQDIPARVEVSRTEDNAVSVVVYIKEITKLVSMRVVVEYVAAEYKYRQGEEITYTDENGDEYAVLPGMWTFGALANGKGCTGAFVSINGVTKSSETAVCRFVVEAVDGNADVSDLSVSVTELVTDDNNEENDIYNKTIISMGSASYDKPTVFNTVSCDGALTLRDISTENDAVFVPESIDGTVLRRVKTEGDISIPFLIFGRNILSVNEGAFSEKTTVVAPKGSAPVGVARKCGAMYLEYNESVVIDVENKLIITDAFLVNKKDMLFSGNADYEINPSYVYDGGYFGTGSKVSVVSNNKKLEMTLCVKGDVNGDSVCDVVDVALCERFINGFLWADELEKVSMDMDNNGKIDVSDYSAMVNVALDGEYRIFNGIKGDIDGDYAVDALDVVAFNRLSSETDLSTEEQAKCDFDNDGKITEADKAVLIELVFNYV